MRRITRVYFITVRHSSADTAVRAMNDFNIFRGLTAPKPFDGFSKNFAQLITSTTPPHMQTLRSVGSKGACLRMREVVAVRRLFFYTFFLSLMRIATGPPAGPINAVNGSNDASCWHSYSFYGLDN